MILHKHMRLFQTVAAGALFCLAGCGSGSQTSQPAQTMSSGNFSGAVATPGGRTTDSLTGRTGVASVTLNPVNPAGGIPTMVTVHLTQPAPAGGIAVQLKSSDTGVVPTPETVTIPAGQTSSSFVTSTSQVTSSTTVAISALYGDTVAGTSLLVSPAVAKYQFSITVQPTTVTIAPGQSGSATVTTRIKSGYSHTLQLTVSKVPVGVSVTLTPSVIPAPGAGTSNAELTVPGSMAPGTYSIRLTASDGTTSRSVTLKLQVSSSDPGATFQGCWYQQNGHHYQGVRISVTNPGTYPFDAVLYRGATCDPNQKADEFGYGTPLNFGGFDYIFWFADFADQTDMSAFWYVGNDRSQCVNYTVAPSC